ncbi:ribosomal protein S18-alanine N-acetyltransferase [Alteromonas sp. CI.11.F.A3]|uniref:ribosomal protein S18-alanine N-acetyltransferase n=1 Tax=Alteromonas sp. CI.11.F.A3 TaxID=3079555 RepID=UPI00294337E9|nr:ribosomal protein S18-alanine N-acetyltransferase [Alteromonas sp. CI.11.F.A3]WOI36541.1 ribosomal protein S18-alanine N-acetyltransferase [Alteromonas sp. CI.11.F.A3]
MHIQLVSDTSCQSALAQAHGIHEASQFKPWSFATFADCTTAPYFGALAIKDDQVVGYALVLEVVDEATLMDIAVDKRCRQEGIGRALVEYVKQHAQHNEMTSMWLEVRASNIGAINLYEHTGFEHIEVRKSYYQTANGKEDAKIMKASL